MRSEPTGNHLLDSLPASELAAIRPDLHDVSLRVRETVYRAEEPVEFIYFPIDCVISVLTVMRNGDAVEVATIGHEGLSGSQLAFQADRSRSETMCQLAGLAKCMRASAFSRHFEKEPSFRRLVYGYVESLFDFMSQSIACNRLHTLNERCARWLLSTQDRVGSNHFSLTQEFLAMMLGTSRPAVTLAAGALQEAGLISYHRGQIHIRDRENLKLASCECYEATQRALGNAQQDIPAHDRIAGN